MVSHKSSSHVFKVATFPVKSLRVLAFRHPAVEFGLFESLITVFPPLESLWFCPCVRPNKRVVFLLLNACLVPVFGS